MLRVVADLGNSRLKWARVGADGQRARAEALPVDDPSAWSALWSRWARAGEPSSWAVTTVNPPVAEQLAHFIAGLGSAEARWFRSAADVPVRHALETPETTGADRALAVAAAMAMHAPSAPGIVVSCGSAITVERVGADGVWHGGAIAPGLGLSARALHILTAQLPLVVPRDAPPAWGHSTRPALEAGLFWGVVGLSRELVARQSAGLDPEPWLVWTGGDAAAIAPWVEPQRGQVVPDLVLEGLARVAFAHDATSS